MSTLERLRTQRQTLVALAAQHGAENIRVFGSVAREEDAPSSDVDLLVNMQPGRSLLDLVALKREVEDLLQRRADIVTENSLHPLIRNQVVEAALPL